MSAWAKNTVKAVDFYESCEYRACQEIGELFGLAAHIGDDGIPRPEIQIAKLPSLVRELLSAKGFASARLPMPQQPPSSVSAGEAKAFTKVAWKAREPQTLYSDIDKGDSPKKE